MQDIAIQKAHELPSDARRVVERVLGRNLREDDEVSIMAFSPHETPTGEVRLAVARQFEERLDQTARRVRNTPEEALEQAINKAVDHVRSHPE